MKRPSGYHLIIYIKDSGILETIPNELNHIEIFEEENLLLYY